MVAWNLAKVFVGVRFSYPAPNNTVLSSMDRISGFEPEGVGSIPAGPAK